MSEHQPQELLYPITSTMTFAGADPCVMQFEDIDQWSDHIQERINKACKLLGRNIVPRDENKKHAAMFDEIVIEYVYENGGAVYGCIRSQLHMPVPALTLLQ